MLSTENIATRSAYATSDVLDLALLDLEVDSIADWAALRDFVAESGCATDLSPARRRAYERTLSSERAFLVALLLCRRALNSGEPYALGKLAASLACTGDHGRLAAIREKLRTTLLPRMAHFGLVDYVETTSGAVQVTASERLLRFFREVYLVRRLSAVRALLAGVA